MKDELTADQIAKLIAEPPDIDEDEPGLLTVLREVRVRNPKRRFKKLFSFSTYEPWVTGVFKRQHKCNICGELGPVYWCGAGKFLAWTSLIRAPRWREGHKEYHIDQIRRKR